MEFWNAFVSLIPVTLVQSLLYAYAALAIMLPFRILNFPGGDTLTPPSLVPGT